ncbi:MAG: hypothetical protein HYY54_03545 [candidate division NC10 bacterium]|nr:hypothetical protein [candidate division NC10 bacterium]
MAEDRLLAAALRQVLGEAIDTLPADYRAVVVLRDMEGLSNQQAADVLETTVLAFKSRLHRAHLLLRERLARYFESGRTGAGDPSAASPPEVRPANLPPWGGKDPGEDTPHAAGAGRLCVQGRRRPHLGAKTRAGRVHADNPCRPAILW